MLSLDQYLADKLKTRENTGNLRRLSTGRAGVDFFSNDYLGFVTNGVLAELVSRDFGNKLLTGSTGSRLLSGNNVEINQLENQIAQFHRAEAALVFNSGYDANTGLISCITDRHTIIIYDELCHASIHDGIRLGICNNKFHFGHNDLADLETKLAKYSGKHKLLVVVESVYSMDGDLAPLVEIVGLCENYGANLIIDEAHATGVIGQKGEGLVNKLGLENKVLARVHTFGKALGSHGAAVLGSQLLKQYLINFARPFIYSTALPMHSLLATKCAYDYLGSATFTNKPLNELIAYFRTKVNDSGIEGWMDSQSPIQPLVIGSNVRGRQIAIALQDAGLQVNPILHPTIPLGMERLRICLHTFNTREQIDQLFKTIKDSW